MKFNVLIDKTLEVSSFDPKQNVTYFAHRLIFQK